MPIKIFISHSSYDEPLAKAIVKCITSSMILGDNDVRCTSVPGYRLPIGSDFAQTLREELNESSVVVGLITQNAIKSSWVLFELGATWGADKKLKPLVSSGVNIGMLPGPLSERHVARLTDRCDVVQFIDELATLIDAIPKSPSIREDAINDLLDALNKQNEDHDSKDEYRPKKDSLIFSPDDEYYKLYGLKGVRTDDPLIQDFRIIRTGNVTNIDAVQFLWADTLIGNSINAEIIKDKKTPYLRVRFDNKGGWGCNLAIRSQGERACRNKGYRFLKFQAIIPADEIEKDPTLLKEVGIAIQVVNGRLQHWEYSVHPNQYLPFPVSESDWGSEPVKIDLNSNTWHLFTSDGNNRNYPDDPNFSVISSVVLKFGRIPDVAGELAPGKGIIDIKSLYLSD